MRQSCFLNFDQVSEHLSAKKLTCRVCHQKLSITKDNLLQEVWIDRLIHNRIFIWLLIKLRHWKVLDLKGTHIS